jgi:hypothetical protein
VSGGEVELRLTADEALVLSDLLWRWIDREGAQNLRRLVEDDAEIWALNAVNCLLERTLVEPLQPDYKELLVAARERLKKRAGGAWPRSDDVGRPADTH